MEIISSDNLESCKLVVDSETKAGENLYYYSEDGIKVDSENNLGKKACTGEKLLTTITAEEPIAEGTVTGASMEGNESIPQDIITVDSTDSEDTYYYLVIEFPDDGKSQNDGNMGKAINANIKLDGTVTTKLHAENP